MIPERTLKILADGLGIDPQDIEIVDEEDCLLDTQLAAEKSLLPTKKVHCSVLEIYIQHGWEYDYKETVYWERARQHMVWSDQYAYRKLRRFFELYEEIKTNGFRMTHDPITLIDLKEIRESLDITKIEEKWSRKKGKSFINSNEEIVRYYRINGSHRIAVALVLGIEEVPVKIIRVRIKDE